MTSLPSSLSNTATDITSPPLHAAGTERDCGTAPVSTSSTEWLYRAAAAVAAVFLLVSVF
jgi:hypothetical protein